MSQVSRIPNVRNLFFMGSVGSLLLLAACGGSGKSTTTGEPPPAIDDDPPFTTASPGGGLYPAHQFVTLASNESATIYYTTDGNLPSVGGVTTVSGPSPIDAIWIDHPLALKFFAVDVEGNVEFVRTENYDLDLDPPNIFINDFLLGTHGFLENLEVVFASDEAGNWFVEFGGTGEPGSGTLVGQGAHDAGVLITVPLPVWRLPIGAQTEVHIRVTDPAGGLSSFSLPIDTAAAESFAFAGTTLDLLMAPDGLHAYALRPDEGQIWVIDTDPLSATYNTISSQIDIGANPTSMDVSSDGAVIYATCDGSIWRIVTATQVTTAIPTTNGVRPSGIALHPTIPQALFATDGGSFWILDINPLSPGYHLSAGIHPGEPGMTDAQFVISPGGERAVIVWHGAASYGIKVLNTDNASPDYLSAPQDIYSGLLPQTLGDAVIDTLAERAWFGGASGKLTRADLSQDPAVILNSSPTVSLIGVTLTPDESLLILTGGTLNGIRIVDPISLQVLKFVESGGATGSGTGSSFAVTPDGQRAYLVRDNASATGEIWMLRLEAD